MSFTKMLVDWEWNETLFWTVLVVRPSDIEPDNYFRVSDDSHKTFSFTSRNAVSAPQRAHVRKTDWKYKYFVPTSTQYYWSARAGKVLSSDGGFIRTDRAAQNWERKLIGYKGSRYNQAVAFLTRCRRSVRTLFDGGARATYNVGLQIGWPNLVSLSRLVALVVS